MAALRADQGPGNGDRGQLILVAGLAVAVTLVAMVLLLNTVIYTQNLATRGAQVEDGQAVAFRGEVVADVGGLLDAENRGEHASWDAVRDATAQAVVRYDQLLSRYHGERGTVAEIERGSLSLTEGVLLRQTDASRNFTAVTDERVDWTLARDASGVRNFRLTVSEAQLVADEADAFAVRLDGSETRRVFVYAVGGDVVVSDGGSDTCTVPGPTVTIDLTAETVDGTACSALDYPTGADSHDIAFENPENATGTYELTLDASESSPAVSENFAAAGETELPREVPAVYAAAFEIHFETPRVVFHTAVRSVPGEPR